nr:FxLYD domain-containing protein [Clostridioides difficile]
MKKMIQKKKIDAMVKGIKFEKVKDEYDWKTYQATVENTSDLDLQDFYLDINLIDKDGVIIETQTSTSVNGTWKKGQKVRLEFNTDKNFEKIEWTPHYSANNYSIIE